MAKLSEADRRTTFSRWLEAKNSSGAAYTFTKAEAIQVAAALDDWCDSKLVELAAAVPAAVRLKFTARDVADILAEVMRARAGRTL